MPDRPPYLVLASPTAQRDFGRLPPGVKERIRAAMIALADDPRGQSEKLASEDAYRERVGDYRVAFRVDDSAQEVLVTRIKHRGDVYRR
ncbi:MAG: type II toxin-antitoxin system RelE/ParE family toxin [Actinomycetota bacterium]|nr:type II toxin-antitoxin system RelE/ParE family toxin [Actinomycetota bacterium]